MLAIMGFLVLKSRKVDIPKFNQQEEWGKIHKLFEKNPGWVEAWKKEGYNYEEARKWISVGINPWELIFLYWLTEVLKKTRPEVSPTWWKAKSNKEEIKWNFRKAAVEKITNPDKDISLSDLKNEIKNFCLIPAIFELKVSLEEGEEMMKFTELSQYEEFLQKKGKKWEYYELTESFLKKWKEVEKNN
ncbi:hypothetical protein [endosymbiont GvMRE of Glomus versiforme]|uniref:hypothetical protein n=1 Tax=endosymbiont GvMRE of Glomus versiforme TaxID=2039283 RepID=UPI000EF108F1|nr:hypothetical protein [endosymbiont GvMRE of Glomus versiforme]RHZ35572.1 hypothetical protein GvMRE_IIg517 [endosymbiont GvMRE of Glomus versiforme]